MTVSLSSATPLFLLGCPRSGTTALCRFLNAHPNVVLTNETAVWLLLNDIQAKARLGIKSGILYGKDYFTLWADHVRDSTAEITRRFYEKIAIREERDSVRYWGDKHPHYAHCLDFIAEQFPNARFIYLVRDPRDAACSIAAMNSVEFDNALANWKSFSDKYEAFFSSLSSDRGMYLRYEDLVEDYAGRVKKVLEWLELPWATEVADFLEDHAGVDAHTLRGSVRRRRNFRSESIGRWRRELSADRVEKANEMIGPFLCKYGYEPDKSRVPPLQADAEIEFTCNICGQRNTKSRLALGRENRSCDACGSSVRLRSIISELSQRLFGERLPIPRWKRDRSKRGIGLSDWLGYAKPLSKKVSYTNTHYHKEPRLDITAPPPELLGSYDFLISSDVFEHVAPPVGRAFAGAFELLKGGGVIVLTVPYQLRVSHTIEHFPELHDWEVVVENGSRRLRNVTADGREQWFDNLKFHGGAGETLEMRVFSLNDLLEGLQAAGFEDIRVLEEDVVADGIIWKAPNSKALSAVKPS